MCVFAIGLWWRSNDPMADDIRMTANEPGPTRMELLSRLTLTVPEAALVLDVGRDAAYQAVQRGEIPVIKIGKHIRVPTAKLRQMLGIAEAA